jgi:hypothetical protein
MPPIRVGLDVLNARKPTQVGIYDVVQTATGNYAAQLSTAVTSGQMPGVLGPIGLEWKVAGIAPLNVDLFPTNLVTNDLVMRNTNTSGSTSQLMQAWPASPTAAAHPEGSTLRPSVPIAHSSRF